jgi:hypothetical protein
VTASGQFVVEVVKGSMQSRGGPVYF